MKRKIAIIGGGAAGFMSAVACADKGADAVIIERKDRVLKKVLATGNGRCNFSNINAKCENYYGCDNNFAGYALDCFSPKSTIKFFETIGIMHRIEENGKVYPLSGQASSVVDALRFRADYLGVQTINNFDVTEITKRNRRFLIYARDGNYIEADKVIVAAGGKASPDLCSVGSGYRLMSGFGHNVTALYPALVQLKTEKENIKGLQGIKADAFISVLKHGEIVGKEYNEVLFTDYGISGSAVFNLSYLTALYDGLVFRIDFLPDYEEKRLTSILKERRENLSYLNMDNFLNGVINKKLGQSIVKQSGVEKLSFPVSELTDHMIERLVYFIKNYDIKITGTTGFKNAQVTAGGLLTNEFDDKTMESKKVKGLFAAGEILDIFGDCGGYNLQWAWSSGYLAGVSAAAQ